MQSNHRFLTSCVKGDFFLDKKENLGNLRRALPIFTTKLSTLTKLIKYLNKHASNQQPANFLSEGVRCGLDKEIALDGTYLKYFPFRAMIERSQMTPYHKKLKVEFEFKIRNLLVECSLNLSKLIYRRKLGLNAEVELNLRLGT